MAEMTNEAFQRVQSFSADWHANTFAGATVRRISRAMWGYDVVSDAVIAWIGPALIVLAVLSIDPCCVGRSSARSRWRWWSIYIAITVSSAASTCMKANRRRWRWIRASAGRWPTRSPRTRRSRASARKRARRRGSAS